MGWLSGEVAVVTGGGSGLGRALVDRFVTEGARVCVLERSADKAGQLESDHAADRVRVVVGDATAYRDNQQVVDMATAAFGSVTCFVANAGIWDFRRSLRDLLPVEIPGAFQELFSLNVMAPLLGAKAALEGLRASRGSVTVTLSNAALFPGGGGPLYVASKHAGVGLVRQLAYELAPEVRVNGVAPGGMPSDLRGPRALNLQDQSIDAAMDMRAIMQQFGPLAIPIEPVDYTSAFVLVASRQHGKTITGSVLDVCGGLGVARPPQVVEP